jgi:hypothetical protein
VTPSPPLVDVAVGHQATGSLTQSQVPVEGGEGYGLVRAPGSNP